MKGFTFIGIVAMVSLGALSGAKSGNELSFGFNGVTETRCIGSYRFVVGADGQARQVLDEFGKGAKCEDK